MSDDIERRMRAARERWVEIGGKRYKIRRPLRIEVMRMMAEHKAIGERLALDFVVDWSGITEADLLPGVGGDEPMPFVRAAYHEWIGDRMDDLAGLAKAIWSEYQSRNTEIGAIPEKSQGT